MTDVWNGAFAPIGPNGRKKKLSTDPNKPDVVEVPPVPIPDILDLEQWRGDDRFIHQAWSYDGVVYLTVHFDHVNVCFDGENPPSNFIPYVYIWDENDLEDAQFGELGDLFE